MPSTSEDLQRVDVTFMGLPSFGFPEELIDPKQDWQIVRVPYFKTRRVTYACGVYLLIVKQENGTFAIKKLGLQPHLLQPI